MSRYRSKGKRNWCGLVRLALLSPNWWLGVLSAWTKAAIPLVRRFFRVWAVDVLLFFLQVIFYRISPSLSCVDGIDTYFNMRFLVRDVRDMSIFPKESFDIVLFSFNGIDCLSHEDRLNALREIQRVLKTNAFFMFSAHNLQFAPRLFRKVQVRPIWWTSPWGHLFMNMKRRKLNPEWHSLAEKNYAIIDDGTYDWRLGGLYYVDPQYQVTQLHNTGFSNVRIFSLKSGLGITLEAELKQNRDWWLYYLCQQGPQSLC